MKMITEDKQVKIPVLVSMEDLFMLSQPPAPKPAGPSPINKNIKREPDEGKHDDDRSKEEPVKKKLRPSRPLKHKTVKPKQEPEERQVKVKSNNSSEKLLVESVVGGVPFDNIPEVNDADAKQKMIDELQDQFVIVQSENLYKTAELKDLQLKVSELEKGKSAELKDLQLKISELEKENQKLKTNGGGAIDADLKKENEKLKSGVDSHVKSATELLKTINAIKTKVDQVKISESKQVKVLQLRVSSLEADKTDLLRSLAVFKKRTLEQNHTDCDKKVKDLMIERLNLFQNLTEENNKVVALEKKLSDFETSMTNITDENISLKKNQNELDKALKTFKNKIEEFTEDKKKLEDAKKKVKVLEEEKNLAIKSFTRKLEEEKKNTQKEQKKVKELKKQIDDLEDEVQSKTNSVADLIESSEKEEMISCESPNKNKDIVEELENDISDLSSPSHQDKVETKNTEDQDKSQENSPETVEEHSEGKKSPFRNESVGLPSFDKIMSKYENLVMPTKILNFSFADNNGNPSKEEPSKETDKTAEIDSDDVDIDSLLGDIEEPSVGKVDLTKDEEKVDLTNDEEDDIEKDLTIDLEASDDPAEELSSTDDAEEESKEIAQDQPFIKEPTEVKLMFVSDEKVEPVREIQDLEPSTTTIFDAIKELEDMKAPSTIFNNLEIKTGEKQSIPSHCSSCGTNLESSPKHLIDDQCRKKMEYIQEGLEISCDYCNVKMDHWVTACKLLINFCEICHCWGHDGDTHVTDSEIPNDNDFTVTYSENKKLEAMLQCYNELRTKHYTYESRHLPENTMSEDGQYKYSGTIEDVKKLLSSK